MKTPRRPARCSNAKRYKGIKPPRCSGGRGCEACWAKFVDRTDMLMEQHAYSRL